MSKHNDRKHSGRKGVMGTFLALLLIGALAIAVPVIMQDILNGNNGEWFLLNMTHAAKWIWIVKRWLI